MDQLQPVKHKHGSAEHFHVTFQIFAALRALAPHLGFAFGFAWNENRISRFQPEPTLSVSLTSFSSADAVQMQTHSEGLKRPDHHSVM